MASIVLTLAIVAELVDEAGRLSGPGPSAPYRRHIPTASRLYEMSTQVEFICERHDRCSVDIPGRPVGRWRAHTGHQ
jgi:hypothetical protein